MLSIKTTPEGVETDIAVTNPILNYLRTERPRRTDAEWLDAILLTWSRWLGWLAESGQRGSLGSIPAEYGFTPRAFGDFGPAYDDIEDALDVVRHTGIEDDVWCAECETVAIAIRHAARVMHLIVVADERQAVAA
ncbi:hypothetical protein GCM10025867_50580 (plasmid) [Frondihabitans sucicola]|uniref:Uncharacterized protein n=1 Tax=Frondihabitans sucicola TaxID=1268041 RepID=A0ABM8GWQ9_9MICO|nr:hypothetical protein [Frondihabitans sucicola]BDZ52817.1 hypothetical protein GCM10025867_50580 [Frondihabitans sucicola]